MELADLISKTKLEQVTVQDIKEHSKQADKAKRELVDKLKYNREAVIKDHQRHVKENFETRIKGLQTKFNAQTQEEFEILRKLHEMQIEEKEMLKLKKQKYGEFVKEHYTPVISEKLKNERIENIVSPKQFMGKGMSHSDPRFWIDNPNRGLPKSLESGSSQLPEIVERRHQSK